MYIENNANLTVMWVFDVYIIKHCKLVAAATKYASSLKYSSQFIPVYFSRNVKR